jgi:hypothetical protein
MDGKKNRIAFLFGAGISNISNTEDITSAICQEDKITKHSDGTYLWNSSLHHNGNEKTQAVTLFIKLLKRRIEEYYYQKFKNVRYEANYEDIYSLIKEIEDHITDHRGFVQTETFLENIYPEINAILRSSCKHVATYTIQTIPNLLTLCDEAMRLIENIVSQLLGKDLSNCQFEYLGFLKEAVITYSPDNIDIFTLNHDDNGEWNSTMFDSSDGKVALYKLHGSVQWQNHCLHSEMKQENICASTNEKNTSGDEGRPVILIGRNNKFKDYYKWNIFAELHRRFKESLCHTERLIISGYSFGDEGINNRIVDWLVGNSKRKAIIIDPDPDDIFSKTPTGFADALCRGQVKIFKNKIEEIKWNEIEKDL